MLDKKKLQTSSDEEVIGGETQTNETSSEETKGESQTPNKTPSSEENEPSSDEVERLKREIEELKKKLSASARGVQKILDENKRLKAQIAELVQKNQFSIPAEEVLKSEIPEWEIYDEEQKKLLIKLFELATKQAINATRSSQEFKLVEELYEQYNWEKQFSEVVKEYPELKDKKEEFKEFSYQPENRTIPLSVLAEAFLFRNKNLTYKSEPQQPKVGLERPSGGERVSTTPTMTGEDWLRLAQKNPSEFLKRGKEFEAWLRKQEEK